VLYTEYLAELKRFNPWKPHTLPDGSVLQLTPHGHVLRENNVIPFPARKKTVQARGRRKAKALKTRTAKN